MEPFWRDFPDAREPTNSAPRAGAQESCEGPRGPRCVPPSSPQCVLSPLAFPWSTDRSHLAATVGLPLGVHVDQGRAGGRVHVFAGADLTHLTAHYSRRAPRHVNDIDSKGRHGSNHRVFLRRIVVLGTMATPGLAGFALVVAPLLGLWFLWRIALTVSTHGRPIDAVAHTRQSHLLGPGGPDDSFAASPLDEDEDPTEASARASVSGRNGLVRGANVPRPGLSETLSARPRGENSIEGGGG